MAAGALATTRLSRRYKLTRSLPKSRTGSAISSGQNGESYLAVTAPTDCPSRASLHRKEIRRLGDAPSEPQG